MRYLRNLGILAVIVVLLFIAFRFATASTLIVEISNDVKPTDTATLVNDKPAALTGSDNGKNRYITHVGRGTHTIEIRSAGYEPFTITVSSTWRSTKTVVADLKTVAPESATETLYKDVEVNNPRYFENNTWGVFQLGEVELITSVARLNQQTGEWEAIEEGTDVDISYLKSQGAPNELILYLGGTL